MTYEEVVQSIQDMLDRIGLRASVVSVDGWTDRSIGCSNNHSTNLRTSKICLECMRVYLSPDQFREIPNPNFGKLESFFLACRAVKEHFRRLQ